jgi:hypothetical protein
MKSIVRFLLECMLKARAIDGIYLRFVSNTQGGHEIMNLSTAQIIRR